VVIKKDNSYISIPSRQNSGCDVPKEELCHVPTVPLQVADKAGCIPTLMKEMVNYTEVNSKCIFSCEDQNEGTIITKLDQNLYAVVNLKETLDIRCPGTVQRLRPIKGTGTHLITLKCHCGIHGEDGKSLVPPQFPCPSDKNESSVHLDVPGSWTKMEIHQDIKDWNDSVLQGTQGKLAPQDQYSQPVHQSPTSIHPSREHSLL
jgi:hypothetical protein